MVTALHAAGLEVVLDVVYNHTAEQGRDGPTLSLRGLANRRTTAWAAQDATTSTTPAAATPSTSRNPHTLQLVTDSLRYWVTEMHVDGFRFDLAAALARSMHDVDMLGAFFAVIAAGPGAAAGQADRRAVGRRPGRLPGRRVPVAVDGVERPLPRHRARLLARRVRRRPRPGHAGVGVERPLRRRPLAGPSRPSTS